MENNSFKIVNGDTDSISFCKSDGNEFTKKEQTKLLNQINSLMEPGILWTDDGVFPLVAIVAAKNYILFDGKKIKIKGSALKGTKKEPRLKAFMKDIIDCIVNDSMAMLPSIYYQYAHEIMNIPDTEIDILQYCFKISVTKAVLNPTTSFNQKVHDALARNNIELIEGDKHYLYFKESEGVEIRPYTKKDGTIANKKHIIQNLGVSLEYDNDICRQTLLKKLFVTVKIFHRILDMSKFPNLTLKKNLQLLQSVKKV